MKTTNTLIINSLLLFSLAVPLSAADFAQHTAEMNNMLQGQIDKKIDDSLQLKVRPQSQLTGEENFGLYRDGADNSLTDTTT